MEKTDKNVIDYIERAWVIMESHRLFIKYEFPILTTIEIAKMIQLEELNKVEITGISQDKQHE